MKFKICKNDLETLLETCKNNNNVFIELEPQFDTATEAIFHNQEKMKLYNLGYEDGFRTGWNDNDGNHCYKKCYEVLCNPSTCRFNN